jgi:hypothetical protein
MEHNYSVNINRYVRTRKSQSKNFSQRLKLNPYSKFKNSILNWEVKNVS